MDYISAINRVYDHLENDDVDKAVMTCLRIARNLQDFLYIAIFLRELYPVKRDFLRVLYDETNHLNEEAKKYLYETSLENWIDTHTLPYSFAEDNGGDEKNILAIGVGEIKSYIEQWEKTIQDLTLPSGMGKFDTAAFTEMYNHKKELIRERIRAANTIKERIKTKCLNYAIKIERQIQSQQKSETFLQECYNEVNNYFKAHSEDVYTKLQKASQLVGSNDPEDFSLLLTQVRRAIKAAADFFYPPKTELVTCSDGQIRVLGNEQYLNRFQEFILTSFQKSSSRALLKAEFEYLSVFARRLHDVASKGVHSEVTMQDAKQGIIGLYMFLYNIIVRIQGKAS